MSGPDGMPIVNYGPDPHGAWKRGVSEAGRVREARLSPNTDFQVYGLTGWKARRARVRRWLRLGFD